MDPSLVSNIQSRQLHPGLTKRPNGRSSVFRSRRWAFTAALTLAGAAFAVAPEAANAQNVVQQPTFGVFSVGTTVSVPDRGGALLGGVNRAAVGSVERGVPGLSNLPYAGRLFKNRAIGSRYAPSTMSVHAQILDFEAMDEALLAEAARRRQVRLASPKFDHVEVVEQDVQERAEFLSRNIGRRRK